MVRQMWDIQQGTRSSEASQLMKIIVANLTPDDLIAIAAYVSSRVPSNAANGSANLQ
jgi:cytochrome c553